MHQSRETFKSLGDVLKKAREQAGFSKSGIAKKAGVAVSSYWEWENGTKDPSLRNFQPVIAALGEHARPLLKEIGYAP